MRYFAAYLVVFGAISSVVVYALLVAQVEALGLLTLPYLEVSFSLADVQRLSVSALVLCAVAGACSYLAIVVVTCFQSEQNLRRKYDAEWALVTGSSSGIGKEIAHRLAKQGLNVVMAAPAFDKLHTPCVEEFQRTYPAQKFRQANVNLSDSDGSYMEELRRVTDDILVQIVFSNAGYMRTGLFSSLSAKDNLDNFHCNATASVHVTHHFLRRLKAAGKRGCFVYTSSPANMMPAPMSAMYCATKAFLTGFATSLAPEVKSLGIDVAVIHPSPVTSRFYDGAHSIGALLFFKGTGRGPEVVVNKTFQGIGRQVIIDQGYYAIGLRMVLKVVDVSFLTEAVTATAHTMADYIKLATEKER
jgi:short-subunit dehydrogenase